MGEAELRLRLLGAHAILLNGEDIAPKLPAKGCGLLIYLAVTQAAYMRTTIVNLLWPHSPLPKARVSLRVLLHRLRQQDALNTHFQLSGRQLQIRSDLSDHCDLFQFRAGALTVIKNEADARTAAAAVSRYRGAFLTGFDALDALPFDRWVEQTQFSLQLQAQRTLHALATYYDAQDNPEKALPFARKLVDINPVWEAHQRTLIWLLARTGQHGAAISQYQFCRRLLRTELQSAPEPETLALVAQIENGDVPVVSASPRPLPSAAKADAPFEAPARPPRFLGRSALAQTMQRQIETATTNRFYLTGLGGVGKTTAVTHLAYQWRSLFADGVLWMDAARETPLTVAERWSEAYGYDFHSIADEAKRLAALRRVLAQQEALIIIDDVTAAAPIRPLLPKTGACTILFTGRDAGLAPLLNAEPVSLPVLSPEDGRSLLVQIISQERAKEDEDAVRQICSSLDNLPLALTIAGHYLVERPQRKLADFARQLAEESARLDIAHANRQVRASFQTSWQTMHPEEQHLFCLLGVFDGRPFSVDALAAVAELDPLPAAARLDDLINLSLLQEDGRRFWQHPLLAEFAREKLGANQAAYRRYAHYFLSFARKHQTNYEMLRPEWANLLSAVQVAHQEQLWETAVELTTLLQPVWFRRGRYSEARRAFQTAHRCIMRLEDEKAFADNQLRWGQACMEQGEYDEAQEHFLESLTYYHNLGDAAGVATAQADLARIDLEQSRHDEALQRLEESRALREQIQDAAGVAETIYRLARVQHRRRENDLARRTALEALSIQEEIGHHEGAARTLRLLTFIEIALENYAQANAYAEQALALAQSMQNDAELVAALYTISNAQRRLGELEAARRYAKDGLKLNEKIGDRQTQARLLFQMCLIHKALHAYETACDLAQQSLTLFEAVGDFFNIVGAQYQLGDIHEALGATEAARQIWADALEIARQTGDHTMVTWLQERLASL